MKEYVIEKNGLEVFGVSSWNDFLRESSGLMGNLHAPSTPFQVDAGTVREVVRPDLLPFQTYAPGQVVGGKWVLAAVDLDDISEEKRAVSNNIDLIAGDVRARYVTAIWGQETVYLAKEQEALAWQNDSSIETPYLTAEANALGVSVSDRVTQVLANATAWRSLSVAIETNRMVLKSAVDSAITASELRAIDSDSGWPSL